MTHTLHMMRGYPGSGKSTVARKIAKETGAIRICRDDLRMMILDSYFTGKQGDEMLITVAEKALVHRYLEQEYSVVVDATNLHPRALQSWASIAESHGAELVVHDVTTPENLCVLRDTLRGKAGERCVGGDVIRQMARKYPIATWVAHGQS